MMRMWEAFLRSWLQPKSIHFLEFRESSGEGGGRARERNGVRSMLSLYLGLGGGSQGWKPSQEFLILLSSSSEKIYIIY